MRQPARILVCGAIYGASYLRALRHAAPWGQIAGVLGRGGPSSQAHARALCVPYFGHVSQVSGDGVDAVCVAVGGSAGVDLAEAFLDRGLPVIQEHPLGTADVLRLQNAAARNNTVWHINAHFGDLPAISPFITAGQRLVATQSPLYITATLNPRTVYSVADVLLRILPSSEQIPGSHSWQSIGQQNPAHDFMGLMVGSLAGTMSTLHCQRTVSARDDGSATLVGHHLEIGFPCGVLELADTFGPVLFRPNPGRELSPWHAVGKEPAMWECLAGIPNLTPGLLQQLRDQANLQAVSALLTQASGGPAPAWQAANHQLAVASTSDAISAALGPPIQL